MAANTHERLETARGAQIPWLNSIRRLGGARILEIGSGTGASSVALAEQGAIVTGIDINSSALEVASLRCSLYGLRAEYLERNATEAASISCAKDADFIIFWASLEHMTIRERLDAIRSAWHVLKPGACLVVVNSPNRLWHTDVHTSLEPFYHWLPDDLAYPYSRLTTRANFNSRFVDDSDELKTEFYRSGRGVSFHEFELSLNMRAEMLPIIGSMNQYHRRRRRVLDLLEVFSRDRRYERILRSAAQNIHAGFFSPEIDIALQKRSASA